MRFNFSPLKFTGLCLTALFISGCSSSTETDTPASNSGAAVETEIQSTDSLDAEATATNDIDTLEPLEIEKDTLKFGFIKLTDCAPIVIAKEKGFTEAQVELSVTPPPQMPSTLESGNISGYCVGEPWNQKAVEMGIGVPVTTNYDIWKDNPEKVFGVTKEWADENPNTHIAVVKALIRAGKWLDETDDDGTLINREEACRLLSQPNYVGADFDVIKNSMTGYFFFQKSDKREMPDFNVFFKYYCSYPWYSDGIWFLTQMRRWGQITEAKPEEWYLETAKEVYKPAIYLDAAKRLVAEGHISKEDIPWDTDGFKEATSDFIDGVEYDARKPLEYLKSHKIGNKE